MFKKIFVSLLIVIVVGAVAFSAYNTSQVRDAQALTNDAASPTAETVSTLGGNTNAGNGQGQAAQNATNPAADTIVQNADLAAIPASDLNDAEAAALLYMLEEEKLAHDVYINLYEAWGLATFQNIAASEQMHMDAVRALLDRYALAGPSNAVGVFDNADLQALYNELVARGSQSLAEAIQVGGAIEEIDILDLQTRLAKTDNAVIQQVYNSLMNGSYNHLNAFANALLKQTGETYQPQYLSAEAYQAIAGTQPGNGNGGGQGGGAQGDSQAYGGQGGGKGYRGGRP